MTNTKKSMRFFTVFALIFAMVLSIASVPASAAGVETWYANRVVEPETDVYDYNLTPVKTMGRAGKLTISATFKTVASQSDLPYTYDYVLEIRSVFGNVLARKVVTFTNNVQHTMNLETTVLTGQKIQIYTGIFDHSTGAGKHAYVTYSHQIS